MKKIILYIILIYSVVLHSQDFKIEDNKTIILDAGIFYLKDIELQNNVVIKGKNKFTTILKLDKNAKKALFYGIDKSNITISNLTILNETTKKVPLFHFIGENKQIKNITIKDCIIRAAKAESDVIKFTKYISNIRIENNIIESKKNPKTRRDYKQISCIRLQGVNTHSTTSNSYVYIQGNIIKYGNSGFRISGTGTPPSPILFENNIVQGQNGCGAFFYHGGRLKIINNYFSNIKAVSLKNNDGGVVWLDRYKDGNTIFSGNTIEYNYGNGIFIEELKNAIISNNIIKDNKMRIDDTYKITNKGHSYQSKGGNGILITGGVRGLLISNNQINQNEASGINFNINLGVHHNYIIALVDIKNNFLLDNRGYGIYIKGKNINIKNNTIISKNKLYLNKEFKNNVMLQSYRSNHRKFRNDN